APLVEKVFQKRSKSPIFAVARTIVSSSVGTCCCATHPTPSRSTLPTVAAQRSTTTSRSSSLRVTPERRRPQSPSLAGGSTTDLTLRSACSGRPTQPLPRLEQPDLAWASVRECPLNIGSQPRRSSLGSPTE